MPGLEVDTSPPPQPFGHYELLHEIARGGMGVVYKARQVSLNRTVAVKMLLFGKLAGDEFARRFRAEAEAAASLQHPNIVAIHEVGEHEGQLYFSMDYVDGGNLASLTREKPLPPRRAAEYLHLVASAIHYAHQRGILHCDLKPSNVLIDANDEPRVTDFGLAKRLQGAADSSTSGQILGTPHYMAPEQVEGKRGAITPASDVYSLGAIFYHLLTGRPPFLADSLEEALVQLLHSLPAPLRLLNVGIPLDLETICLKCLSKEPARRYASAKALAEDLGRWLNGEPIHARPIGAAEKIGRWVRRKPAMAALVGALHVVACIGLSGILWQWRRAEQHASRETAQRIRAEEAVTSLELQRAEELLKNDDAMLGLAQLVDVVRQQPTNGLAARRLLSALAQRHFALPVGQPMRHDKAVKHAEFSPDNRCVVTASGKQVRVWEVPTGRPKMSPVLHSNQVVSAQFSPDGEQVLTWTEGFRAFLWDAKTGHALGRPMSHSGAIRIAQFSPDGARVLTASDDGTACVWDGKTGEPLQLPLQHRGAVHWGRFSPDGRQIVTASSDKTAQLWESSTGHPAGKPFQHPRSVHRVEFSPDGRWILTLAADFSVRMWETATGELLAKPLFNPEAIDALSFSPDGQCIVTALRGGEIRLWETRTWRPWARPLQHRGSIGTVEFGPEMLRILSGSADNTARLWDAATGEPVCVPMQHDGLVWSARLSADGLFAVTASADKTARIWDLRPGGIQSESLQHSGPVAAAEFSPDGNWVVTGSMNKAARIWDARTCQQIKPPLIHSSQVAVVRFSPDGSRVATASFDGTARIWDVETGRPLTNPLHHGLAVNDLHFTPDGQWLVTASRGTNLIRLWNAQTGESRGEPIQQQSVVPFVYLSPDGRRLISGDFQKDTAQIRETSTGRLVAEMRGHSGWVMNAEFSPDGRRVVTASEDGSARIWSADTGRALVEPFRHKGRVLSARFSSNGRWIVTASEDATARVWDSQTGQPLGEPLRHGKTVNSAEFSPNADTIVTGSDDHTGRLWDRQTGRAVSEPLVHNAKVVSARFRRDGRRVLTASHDGTARLWDVPPAIPCIDAGATSLLVDWAEASMGKRDSQRGLDASALQFDKREQRLANLPTDSDFRLWLEWLFGERGTRTLSPYSRTTIPDYVESCATSTNAFFWKDALTFCPTNGPAFRQLAKHHLAASKESGSSAATQADWASRQALRFTPGDWESWHVRHQVLEHVGGWEKLLSEAEQVIHSDPKNHYAWNSKGVALQKLSRWDEAIAALSRALEIGEREKRFNTQSWVRGLIFLGRANSLKQLGRLTEATSDNLEGHQLPARTSGADERLIDLGAFYNGGATEEFPGNVQYLAGNDFDFRGWVHLGRPEDAQIPERVDGIAVGRPCRQIHFLHAAARSSYIATDAHGVRVEKFREPFGTVIGHYIIHYDDGQHATVPILYGTGVRDYWCYPESLPDDPELLVAWTGSSVYSRNHGATTRLYKSTWRNPRPGATIRDIDFVNDKTRAVPVLVAITAE